MSEHKPYGADTIGKLKRVMLHCPTTSITRVDERSMLFYLFDSVPDYERYISEHHAYRDLLIKHGIEVFELSDLIARNRELMSYLPNMAYLNDIAVITAKGAIVSSMSPGGRQYEEIVVSEALTALGIPLLHTCGPAEQFEGFMALSPDTLFVAETERFSKSSIERFFSFALQHYPNIIFAQVPKARRFMHPDMVFSQISHWLGLYYPPAFLKCWHITNGKRAEIDFQQWMKERQMALIAVSDEEQQKWATSFVLLEPDHIMNYDISLKPATKKKLESMGVRITEFHPEALLAGGGSLHCLTMRLLRE